MTKLRSDYRITTTESFEASPNLLVRDVNHT